METGQRHSNGLGYLHGGFIMSFIDMAMFSFIFRQLENSAAVTLSCATDFLSPGLVGKPLFATGEILKETGKMLFVRGLVTQDGVNTASFTATDAQDSAPGAGRGGCGVIVFLPLEGGGERRASWRGPGGGGFSYPEPGPLGTAPSRSRKGASRLPPQGGGK